MTCCRTKFLAYCFLFFAVTLFACKQKEPSVSKEEKQAVKKQMVEVNRILIKKDQQRIKGYLERRNLVMNQTKTGLWYKIETEGNGLPVETGKIVSIAYKINLLDGGECYNSESDGVKEFLVGKGGVESGLEEGILLLREGSKATFIMPPYLAHGLTGDGNCIPARAIILYEVEVLSVK